VSTIFNFDIPADYAGKTCNLVFLFPKKKDLETSDYTYIKMGGLSFNELSGAATSATTFNNKPSVGHKFDTITNLEPGSRHVVAGNACGAGRTVTFEVSSVNGLDLSYFQDWNPSPLGLFITAC